MKLASGIHITMLTDLETVFRRLKSEFGLRPIYHHKEERADGHLFITILAYQAVQVIRRNLKKQRYQRQLVFLKENTFWTTMGYGNIQAKR